MVKQNNSNKFTMKCIVWVFLVVLSTSDTFDQFKAQMQSKVQSIATEMENIFARRCDSSIATCETLSYNECEGTSTKKCFHDFPGPSQCLNQGAYLSEASAIRFPNNVNVSQLSTEEKQFVCTSAILEHKFQELDVDRNYRYGKAYIGTSLGSFRSYPTTKLYDGWDCFDYDPRFRPWYVTATSGAKNVILVIDTSGSMTGARITIAKNAASAVINTLSNNDFLGVISFGSTATTVFSSKITRATLSHKQSVIYEVDELETSGQTNYQAAFELGFSMLNTAESDEFGAPCTNGENIFLFLTDGEPTLGHTTSADLINMINGYSKQIKVFAYSLGSGTDTSILQALACEYKGIMFEIPDSATDSALATTMRNYYTYISEGVSISSPVWTEPYEDAFGFGKLVTVSMPIYFQENGVRFILGVAGIDVQYYQIEYGMSEQVVVSKLIGNPPCQLSSLTDCQIEDLRGSNTCGVSNCNSSTTIAACAETASTVFQPSIETGDYKCCGLTIGAFVGIMVAVVVFVALIIGAFIYKYINSKGDRYTLKRARQDETKEQLENPNPNPNPNPYPEMKKNNPAFQENPYFNQRMNDEV